MKKAKTLLLSLGQNLFIAVPDVFKLDIMALLHKYENKREKKNETFLH